MTTQRETFYTVESTEIDTPLEDTSLVDTRLEAREKRDQHKHDANGKQSENCPNNLAKTQQKLIKNLCKINIPIPMKTNRPKNQESFLGKLASIVTI